MTGSCLPWGKSLGSLPPQVWAGLLAHKMLWQLLFVSKQYRRDGGAVRQVQLRPGAGHHGQGPIPIPAGALQIESSEETDQGKYECVATNSAGVRYSSPANLYVRGRELRQAEAGTHCPTLSHLITGLMASWLPCPVQSRAGKS